MFFSDLNTKIRRTIVFVSRKSIFFWSFSFFLTLCLFTSRSVFSSKVDEDPFFSLERISLSRQLVAALVSRDDGRTQRNMAEFALYYEQGFDDYHGGDLSSSLESFKKARSVWPEYFYADLAAAMVYESKGDIESASRYYKSYLNKLSNYADGHMRITAPLIRRFSSGPIEDHDYAYAAVRRRLSRHGIDLDVIRPAPSGSNFVTGVIVAGAFFFTMGIIFHFIIPGIRKKLRENNPPEGFWICTHCGETVPELSYECSSCGEPAPSGKVSEVLKREKDETIDRDQ